MMAGHRGSTEGGGAVMLAAGGDAARGGGLMRAPCGLAVWREADGRIGATRPGMWAVQGHRAGVPVTQTGGTGRRQSAVGPD